MGVVDGDCLLCNRSAAIMGMCHECMHEYVKQLTERGNNVRQERN